MSAPTPEEIRYAASNGFWKWDTEAKMLAAIVLVLMDINQELEWIHEKMPRISE